MLKTIATILYILICVALVFIVLMQEGKNSGLGALAGENTFWGQAKARSKEGRIVKLTYVLSTLFFVLSIALSMHLFNN